MSNTRANPTDTDTRTFFPQKAMTVLFRLPGRLTGPTTVLLLRRTPASRSHPRQWNLPGGGLDHEQDYSKEPLQGYLHPDVLKNAACRELLEETGLEVPPEHLRIWSADGYPHRDGHPAVSTIFYSFYLRGRVRICKESTHRAWFTLTGVRILAEQRRIIPGLDERIAGVFQHLRLS